MRILMSVLLSIGFLATSVFAADQCIPSQGIHCELCEPKGANVKVTFRNHTGFPMPIRYYNWENKLIDTQSVAEANHYRSVCVRKNTRMWSPLQSIGAESNGPAVEGAVVTCWLDISTARYMCKYSAP